MPAASSAPDTAADQPSEASARQAFRRVDNAPQGEGAGEVGPAGAEGLRHREFGTQRRHEGAEFTERAAP